MVSLDELTEKLQQKKAELQNRIEKIDQSLSRSNEPLEKDFAEQAVQRENDDVKEALRQKGRQEILKINKALKRIESDEYLYCSSCGNEIPLERLEIIPYTEYCVKCADKAN